MAPADFLWNAGSTGETPGFCACSQYAAWVISEAKPEREACGRRSDKSDLHFELFAFFERGGEAGKEFGDHGQILQADDFDGRMHIAIGQADQRAGDAAARP